MKYPSLDELAAANGTRVDDLTHDEGHAMIEAWYARESRKLDARQRQSNLEGLVLASGILLGLIVALILGFTGHFG